MSFRVFYNPINTLLLPEIFFFLVQAPYLFRLISLSHDVFLSQYFDHLLSSLLWTFVELQSNVESCSDRACTSSLINLGHLSTWNFPVIFLGGAVGIRLLVKFPKFTGKSQVQFIGDDGSFRSLHHMCMRTEGHVLSEQGSTFYWKCDS